MWIELLNTMLVFVHEVADLIDVMELDLIFRF